MIKLLFMLLVPSLLLCQDISSLLPDGFADFKKSEEAEIYKGNELYRLIDGGADIFFEYGFVQALRQRYSDKDDNNSIDIEIYEMKDSAASFGIFSLFTHQTGKPAAGFAEAFGGDEYLLVRKGSYYISLTVIGSSESAFPGLTAAAEYIEKNILYTGIPALANKFKNYTTGKIVYIEGSLGLYNLSPVNFGGELKINECVFYQDSISKVFIINNDCRLNTNYTTAINILKNDKNFRMVSSNEEETSFKGTTNIDLCSLENYLVIVFSEKYDLQEEELNKLKFFLAGNTLNK